MPRKAAPPKRPEQIFFDDPALDRLMSVVMTLASETYVLRDRVQVLEEQLVSKGHVDAAGLAAPGPAENAAARSADAAEFANTILQPLLGQQQALGASGRFSLAKPMAKRRA